MALTEGAIAAIASSAATAISGTASSIAGGKMNRRAVKYAKKENEKARQWQKEMYKYTTDYSSQMTKDLTDWQYQNYDSPLAKRNAMVSAGFSPYASLSANGASTVQASGGTTGDYAPYDETQGMLAQAKSVGDGINKAGEAVAQGLSARGMAIQQQGMQIDNSVKESNAGMIKSQNEISTMMNELRSQYLRENPLVARELVKTGIEAEMNNNYNTYDEVKTQNGHDFSAAGRDWRSNQGETRDAMNDTIKGAKVAQDLGNQATRASIIETAQRVTNLKKQANILDSELTGQNLRNTSQRLQNTNQEYQNELQKQETNFAKAYGLSPTYFDGSSTITLSKQQADELGLSVSGEIGNKLVGKVGADAYGKTNSGHSNSVTTTVQNREFLSMMLLKGKSDEAMKILLNSSRK